MACRVGMSTDPNERIDYWKRTEGHLAGRVLATGLTYDDALEVERREARRLGCVQAAGGAREGGRVWAVYHVWGAKVRR